MRRRRDDEVEALWREHMTQGFLVDYVDDDAAAWTEADWAGWDSAVAGHVVTYLGSGGPLDESRTGDLRELVNDGLRALPSLPWGAGRTQMSRLCHIATLLTDPSRKRR